MMTIFSQETIGVRGGGTGGAAAPWNYSNSHIRAKKSGNIRAKPLDFRASNGENIWATDLSPPKRNWSRMPMQETDVQVL